jgi:hypothetical protein
MGNPLEKPPGQPEKPRLVICPHCGGKRKGKDCKPCNGTGKVRDK